MAIGVQGQDDHTDQSVQAYQIVFENGTVQVNKKNPIVTVHVEQRKDIYQD